MKNFKKGVDTMSKKRKKKANVNKGNMPDITIACTQDMNLQGIGDKLNVIYHALEPDQIASIDYKGIEKIMSEIERAKAYHIRIVPIVDIGSLDYFQYFKKYMVELIQKHPEFLFYLRSFEDTEDKKIVISYDPLIITFDKQFIVGIYDDTYKQYNAKSPRELFTELYHYILKLGYSEEEAITIAENIFKEMEK